MKDSKDIHITDEMRARINEIRNTPTSELSVMSKTFATRADLGTTDYKELLQEALEEKYGLENTETHSEKTE